MLGPHEFILMIIVSLVLFFVRGGPKGISRQDELSMGEQIINTLQKKASIELLESEIINSVLQELTHDNVLNFPNIKIYVQKGENEINAMAAPGGFIILTEGFYRIIETEEISKDELAGVLAHEIGHIELKHSVQTIKSNQKFDSVIKSIKILQIGSLKAGVLSEISSILYKSKFSRAKEFEADKFAVKMLYNSKFSPFALGTFLNKINEEYNLGEGDLAIYFSTHPSAEKRIKKINSIVEELRNNKT